MMIPDPSPTAARRLQIVLQDTGEWHDGDPVVAWTWVEPKQAHDAEERPQ
jgi:hypothetical protein